MADKLQWFGFYPGDFLSSSRVKRMSLTEIGMYIQLLSYQWLDGSLPAEIGQLARLVQLPVKRFGRMWANGVLRECFVERDGRLVNERLERARHEAVAVRESKANAGRTSAETRRQKYGSAQPSNTHRTDLEQAVRTAPEPLHTHTHVHLKKEKDPQTPALTRVDVVRDRFEMFWTEYPRKTGKDAAWREWLKRSPDSDLTDLILAKVREQRASAQWLKDGGQFIPHPRTWLHQGRWQDVAQEISQAGAVEMGKTVGNIEALRRFIARGQESA